MKQTLILITVLIAYLSAFTQSENEARKLFLQSDSLYRTGDYLESGRKFEEASKLYKGKVNSYYRYNAMCSWALAKEVDTAFMYLEILANDSSYTSYNHLIMDTDLDIMHADSRWEPLTELVKLHKEYYERDWDKELIERITELRTEDQKWRNMHIEFINGRLDTNKYTDEMIYQNIKNADSSSYVAIVEILDTYGYPGFDVIGEEGASTFWLLVQHQDRQPEVQRHVLKLMKVEVDKDNASKTNYAYLVDRVAVNADEPQVYGTQMILNEEQTSYMPRNVIDPENLNKRRAEVGLGTIESYTQRMNTIYAGKLKKK